MALRSSGEVLLSEIQEEFGIPASQVTGISELYRGGDWIPVHGGTAKIPDSGEIKFSDFYGSSLIEPVYIIIDGGSDREYSFGETTVNIVGSNDNGVVVDYTSTGLSLVIVVIADANNTECVDFLNSGYGGLPSGLGNQITGTGVLKGQPAITITNLPTDCIAWIRNFGTVEGVTPAAASGLSGYDVFDVQADVNVLYENIGSTSPGGGAGGAGGVGVRSNTREPNASPGNPGGKGNPGNNGTFGNYYNSIILGQYGNGVINSNGVGCVNFASSQIGYTICFNLTPYFNVLNTNSGSPGNPGSLSYPAFPNNQNTGAAGSPGAPGQAGAQGASGTNGSNAAGGNAVVGNGGAGGAAGNGNRNYNTMISIPTNYSINGPTRPYSSRCGYLCTSSGVSGYSYKFTGLLTWNSPNGSATGSTSVAFNLTGGTAGNTGASGNLPPVGTGPGFRTGCASNPGTSVAGSLGEPAGSLFNNNTARPYFSYTEA